MSKEIENFLWELVQKYLRFLSFVPFLRFVGVCNNLSFGSVDSKSDIDLFIIAKKNRLFIVRSFVTFLLHILGVRRHGKKVSGRFCLSFFVDDNYLELRKIAIKNDIYLAFWIKNMQAVIDDGVSVSFFNLNNWISEFIDEDQNFSNYSHLISVNKFSLKLKSFFEWILNDRFGNFLERILQKWQLRRAKAKMSFADENSKIIVKEHILKFHNLDRREFYRNKIFSKFGKLSKIKMEEFISVIE